MLAHEARRIREIAAKDTAFQGVAAADLDAAEARLAQAATIDGFRLEAMRTWRSAAMATAVPLRMLLFGWRRYAWCGWQMDPASSKDRKRALDFLR